MCGLLIAVGCLVAEQSLDSWASAVAAQRLISCGSQALELTGFKCCGVWPSAVSVVVCGLYGLSTCGAQA